MTTRAADDYDLIKKRVEELAAERQRQLELPLEDMPFYCVLCGAKSQNEAIGTGVGDGLCSGACSACED